MITAYHSIFKHKLERQTERVKLELQKPKHQRNTTWLREELKRINHNKHLIKDMEHGDTQYENPRTHR